LDDDDDASRRDATRRDGRTDDATTTTRRRDDDGIADLGSIGSLAVSDGRTDERRRVGARGIFRFVIAFAKSRSSRRRRRRRWMR